MKERQSVEKWRQYLNNIAAILFALLLTGSLIALLVTSNNASNQASVPQIQRQIATSPLQWHKVIKVPSVVPAQGWQIVAVFHGTGDKTLTEREIHMPKIWSSYLVCEGVGEASIQIQPGSKAILNTTACTAKAGGLQDVTLKAYSGKIKKLHIRAGHKVSWRVMIIGCTAGVNICGKSIITVLTPAPATTPFPTPTQRATPVKSKAVQTPTPTPTRPARHKRCHVGKPGGKVTGYGASPRCQQSIKSIKRKKAYVAPTYPQLV